MNIVTKLWRRLIRGRICRLHHYNCGECIYKKWVTDKDGTITGMVCRAKGDE